MNKKNLYTNVALAIIILFGIYGYIRINSLSNKIETLSLNMIDFQTKTASTTIELRTSINETRTILDKGLTQQTQNVGAIEQRLQQQVGSVVGTVSTLQKLSKTDPQLLAKYSKVFFLNENYAPARLTEIPTAYKFSDKKAVSINADVWPHLQALIDSAKSSGIGLLVSSGYRSFSEQKALKSDYRVVYGAGTANQFSADQGYSEHQLGTALDFLTDNSNGELTGFYKTPAYQWLLANAYRYGFILSYPKDNQYYVFEPWHWRYVGIRLATDLHDQGKNFYDLDQRKIDEYLVSVFE